MVQGLWALAPTKTPPGAARWAASPTGFDVLRVSLAGMLLFIAFHNLPDDVKNISDLAGYISSEVRANSPATTG